MALEGPKTFFPKKKKVKHTSRSSTCHELFLTEKVKNLYEFRDYYLFKRPLEDAVNKDVDVTKELDQVLKKFNDLEGRALNIQTKHSTEAEQLLSKAIKLDANLLEAWNELGFCYWKKKDIIGAKNCFMKNAKSKVSLRSLAILLRQQPVTKSEQQLQNISEALAKATEAVELDPSDGLSWLVLGNSYLVYFFSVAQGPQKMKQALAAYLQAEKDAVAKVDPDLHYNKGIALQYQEEYLAALESFSKASRLDPAWTMPKEKEQKLIQFLDAAQHLTESKGKLRPKKLQTLLKGLSLKQLGPYEGGQFQSSDGKSLPLRLVPLSSLNPGVNTEVVVYGKVVSGIHSEDSVAFAFCLTDKESSCVMVTVYNLAKGKGVIIGDTVAIPEPIFTQVRFSYKDKTTDTQMGRKFNKKGSETPIDEEVFLKAPQELQKMEF